MSFLRRIALFAICFSLLGVFSCASDPKPVEEEPKNPTEVTPSVVTSNLGKTAILFVQNTSKVTINKIWFAPYIENPILDANRTRDLLAQNNAGSLKPNSQYVFTGLEPGDYFLQEADSNMKDANYYGWWGEGETLTGSAIQKKRTIEAGKVYIAEFKDNGKGDITLVFSEDNSPLK